MDFLRGCEGQGGPQPHRPEGGDSAERCGGGAAECLPPVLTLL